jgi:hypothetical protein
MLILFKILVENLKGRDRFEELGVDGRIIFKWTMSKQCKMVWTGFIWLMVGTSSGLL